MKPLGFVNLILPVPGFVSLNPGYINYLCRANMSLIKFEHQALKS